jgi:hypothetical protein
MWRDRASIVQRVLAPDRFKVQVNAVQILWILSFLPGRENFGSCSSLIAESASGSTSLNRRGLAGITAAVVEGCAQNQDFAPKDPEMFPRYEVVV